MVHGLWLSGRFSILTPVRLADEWGRGAAGLSLAKGQLTPALLGCLGLHSTFILPPGFQKAFMCG